MVGPVFSAAHTTLGPDFYDPVRAAQFPTHRLRYRNDTAAKSIGLDALSDAQWCDHFGKFKPFDAPNVQPHPLALRYHGHQFQNYNPDIGDGRGFLFAQAYHCGDGRLLDLGTKGSGTTPYSRSGDGRLTLKGAVREALATAFLTHLGVNSSKTLSIIETGEALIRGDEPSPTRSAVLVRLSHSHIRFGTFQRLSVEGNRDALERLTRHCLSHYYKDIATTDQIANDSLALFNAVVDAKAKTVAQWMAAGFVHGVLNTDNMNISGESFDYGPYRFLPQYDPGFTAAYFDHSGLYAYGRQPQAVLWNLQQLAGTLTGFVEPDTLVTALKRFGPRFEVEIANAMFRRLGVVAPKDALGNLDIETSNQILSGFFQALGASQIDFQTAFYDLSGGKQALDAAKEGPRGQQYAQSGFPEVMARLADLDPIGQPLASLPAASTLAVSDPSVPDGPPNLLLPQIEAIWQAIDQADDWRAFDETIAAFERRH